MSLDPFIVFGCGGHGRVVVEAALLAGFVPTWIVDDQPLDKICLGVPIVHSSDVLWQALNRFRFVVAIGDNQKRYCIYKKLIERGGKPCSVIHPSAIISQRATIGHGTVVMAGVVVNTGSQIGCNVILNTSCSVDHDSRVEDHVHLCPGVRLAGSVIVGGLSIIGTGSCVIPRVVIGGRVTVGAGSVVIRDIDDGCTAFGNPARIHRSLV
jgi:sugar O-acyltransferase (sialic acid O-acetyltransferase NeuD family)